MKQYAVIGLGHFGLSVAKTLSKLGHEVLLIDVREDLVQEAIDDKIGTEAVCLDATNIHALEEIGLNSFDGVVLAIGENLQDSIIVALNLKELGLEKIIAKASTLAHGKILKKLAVPHVVYPEQDMGERVARTLAQSHLMDGFELGPDHAVIEVVIGEKLIGRNLKQLELRPRFSVYVIAIKTHQELSIIPNPERYLQENDRLMVVGANKQLEAFLKWNQ